METMRPLLIRHIGSFLDQGLAAWNAPDRQLRFLCRMARHSAMQDLAWVFDELPDWRDSIDALPDDPLDAVLIELKWLGLAEEQWAAYLERLALELPGWSGMFLWRHDHPGYEGLNQVAGRHGGLPGRAPGAGTPVCPAPVPRTLDDRGQFRRHPLVLPPQPCRIPGALHTSTTGTCRNTW